MSKRRGGKGVLLRSSIKEEEEEEEAGHPACLNLTKAMVSIIKSYPWQCMECKTCVRCMDPYDEDKMMFCDRCDRGYHTFCVGLKAIPTGRWKCTSCKGIKAVLQSSVPAALLIATPIKAKRNYRKQKKWQQWEDK